MRVCVWVYACVRVQSVDVMCVKCNVYSCEWEDFVLPDCIICIYIRSSCADALHIAV